MAGSKFILKAVLLLVIFSGAALADTLDDIVKRGTLRVGVAEFVPWTIKNDAGVLIGFEIDLANKLADDIGVTAEFTVYIWDEIIAGLVGGEIDIIAGGMGITPERALIVNFSRPTAKSGVGLATNTKMTKDIETLDQLNHPDIILTVVHDTFANSVGQTLFPEANLNVFAERDKAEAAVIDGRAHGYLASMPEARFLTLKEGEAVDLPIREPLIAYSEAIAVRKGEQELLNFLDSWVTARQTDKWLPTTRDYWFGTLDWAQGEVN